MPVTRSQVARAAGVSPAVVSYVLNNGPRRVSPATRARVEAVIKKLGYRPNAIASALRGGTTQSIGYLTPNTRNPFYANLSEAIERHCSTHGYLVLTGNTHHDRVREERYLQTFLDRKVDGLIFASGVSVVDAPVRGLDELPVVGFEQAAARPAISTIATEDVADAGTAVEHLQRHGHRLIGCVAGPPQVPAEARKIAGWRGQQQSVDNPTGDELVAFAETSEAGGNAATLQLLSEHGRPTALHGRRPTALFVASDVQAIGVLFACYELGLRVPQDVAIVSVGGTTAAAFTFPLLTTMRQDVEYIAATATEHLLARIADADTPPLHTSLRGNLVVGLSCGCRPHQASADEYHA
jgi:LacI family transcriptional regulator, galactose operon repressor